MSVMQHRHPLDRPPESSAMRAVDHLQIVRQAAIAIVMAGQGDDEGEGEPAIRDVVPGAVPHRTGPGEWLVVARDMFPDILAASLVSGLPATTFVCDQSDGRVLLHLSGPNVRRILAKGVAVDLHPSVFSPGMSGTMLCGHIAVMLACTAENAFELIVSRSLSRSLLKDLAGMAREFDLSIGLSG